MCGRIPFRFSATAVILAFLTAAPALAQTPVPLQNPRFDPPWSKRADVCGSGATLEEVQVPNGWEPYWTCQSPGDPTQINRTPEYRMVGMDFSYRVRSPETALRYFNFWALNRSAGVYQVVPVLARSYLRFSLWTQVWTSNVDINPPASIEPGDLDVRVCIDTLGRIGAPNFADPDVVCSAWVRPYDAYSQLYVEASARADRVTVILNSRAEYSVKHNDVHADDAELFIVAPPAPPPAPTVVPRPGSQGRVTALQATAILARPDATARVLRRAAAGTSLRVRGVSADGAWYRVTLTERSATLGWVPAAEVAADALAEQLRNATDPSATTLARTRAFVAPRVSARVATTVPSGAVLAVRGKSAEGNWWLVVLEGAPDGRGWVPAASVLASAPADAAPVVP
jgi:hypothetical protein